MRLVLHDLRTNHPKLNGHPVDFSKCGALAFQRANHTSPVWTEVEHDGEVATAEVAWLTQTMADLEVLDKKRVTEDGAESVALTYAHVKAGWVVKRRLQQGESADWLLTSDLGWLALEISGTISGDPRARLKEKIRQVALCTLPAELLAIVVAFDRPSILAASP